MMDTNTAIKPRSEYVKKDIVAFAAVVNQLVARGEMSEDTALTNIDYFTQLMNGTASMDDCWDIMAYGAYKECFALDQNWVIKFASECNRTSDEACLLNKAIDENLGDLFVETYFIPLTGFAPVLYNLEVDSSDNWTFDEQANTYVEIDPDYEPHEHAAYCVIQRRIEKLASECTTTWIHDLVEQQDPDTIFPGLPYNTIKQIPVGSFDWMDAVYKLFGAETMSRFARFCEEEGIYDLHTENIGYRRVDGERIPVIIDWLSSSR